MGQLQLMDPLTDWSPGNGPVRQTVGPVRIDIGPVQGNRIHIRHFMIFLSSQKITSKKNEKIGILQGEICLKIGDFDVGCAYKI